MIYNAFQKGLYFRRMGRQIPAGNLGRIGLEMGPSLQDLACTEREVGSSQPWDVVHIGLHNWWLVKSGKKRSPLWKHRLAQKTFAMLAVFVPSLKLHTYWQRLK